MEIDQARRDDAAGNVADIAAFEPLADFCDFAVAETDIANRVDAL